MIGAPGTTLGAWGAPTDAASYGAFLLAIGASALCLSPRLADAFWGRLRAIGVARAVVAIAAVAASLSLAYVAYYLRGGPRIVDATTYFLQARALSEGHLAWSVAEPSASFRGRFLLFHDGAVSGIFPPGYPLLLALGFLLGAPMIVGPLLGFAIAIATGSLARELGGERGQIGELAIVAALLSLLCAALRYHTADTMSHGAAALATLLALLAALRARRSGGAALFACAGLALGFLLATRFASALAALAVVSVVVARSPRPVRATLLVILGVFPFAVLLLGAQRAATGSFFTTTQGAYYATADGPTGCFRYGFGAHVGCLFEHGDFVRANLQHGYGLLAAVATTARRLRMHSTDIANVEPLALLVLVPLVRRRTFGVTAATALVGAQVVAYVPFYFDGNYPGGGARLFADVLPIEHALAAVGLVEFLPRVAVPRKALALVATALAGFAVHTSFDHAALRDRDGGKPLFDRDVIARAGVDHGLVFVDTDHGFALGHDPDALAKRGLVVARRRGDDHDRLLFERLGRPASFHYRATERGPELVPWAATETPSSRVAWRFELEAEWPPLAQQGGWVEPSWASSTCASAERVLVLHRTPGAERAEARFELAIPERGVWTIVPRVFHLGGDAVSMLRVQESAVETTWTWRNMPGVSPCEELTQKTLIADRLTYTLVMTATGGNAAVDRIELRDASR